ncbi:MAG: antA/AntB antirepressor family protein [Candidatus Auribacterota bacterium]|jgi:phage anti-repressor protein|nr:antA/AntB antirepressor family protein [Candidatus Auribacterota bacterium]
MNSKNEIGSLLPIHESNGAQTVDARQLHEFLTVKTRFNDWVVRRISEYGFEENEDYVPHYYDLQGNLLIDKLLKNEYFDNQPIRVEYEITIDMAKEMAMLEKSKKGRMVRKYFIAAENKLRQILQPVSGVHPIIHSGQVGYPRRELLIASGYSPNSGTISRLKKLFPNDFFMIGRTACVSADFARLRAEQGRVRQLEFEFREKHKAIGGQE